MDIAHRYRALLDGDFTEEETTQRVRELHDKMNLNHELFQTVWGFLTSSERRIWKTYCKG